MDRRTATEALQELSDNRWLAIRVTGERSREYFAHPARRLTEVEHDRLTRFGYEENIPLSDANVPDLRGENVGAKGRKCSAPTPIKGRKCSTKNTNSNNTKNTSTTSSNELDVQARKRALRPEVAALVTSLIPDRSKHEHLIHTAAKAMVELDMSLDTVQAALESWRDKGEDNPARLRGLIEDVHDRDPIPVIKRCLEDPDVPWTPLRRFGFHYDPPDVPNEVRGPENVREWHRGHKRAWLQQLLEDETNRRKKTTA